MATADWFRSTPQLLNEAASSALRAGSSHRASLFTLQLSWPTGSPLDESILWRFELGSNLRRSELRAPFISRVTRHASVSLAEGVGLSKAALWLQLLSFAPDPAAELPHRSNGVRISAAPNYEPLHITCHSSRFTLPGGRGGIRTHGRFLADARFRVECLKPDSATLPKRDHTRKRPPMPGRGPLVCVGTGQMQRRRAAR